MMTVWSALNVRPLDQNCWVHQLCQFHFLKSVPLKLLGSIWATFQLTMLGGIITLHRCNLSSTSSEASNRMERIGKFTRISVLRLVDMKNLSANGSESFNCVIYCLSYKSIFLLLEVFALRFALLLEDLNYFHQFILRSLWVELKSFR